MLTMSVKCVAMMWEHYAEAGFEAKGETSLNTPGYVNMTFRQPIVPVAVIIPWNGPIMFWAMKCAPALAAGCTVVLKSSEKSPLGVGILLDIVDDCSTALTCY